MSFVPIEPLRVATMEQALFAQDTWTARSWLVVDAGVRYDHVAAIGAGAFSPRVAWTIKDDDNRTSVSGSVGLFADKVLLGALAFPGFRSRVVQEFDGFASPSASPIAEANVVAGPLRMPAASRWDLSFDRAFSAGWLTHVRYQERHGRDELLIEPSMTSTGQSSLQLSSDGRSTARSLETTLGYRHPDVGHEFYVSYVRSRARGDLNSFEAIEGLFKDPFVQANQVGPLSADVPNRLLVWGLMRVPGQMTLAPFIDVRSGFPYSAIDDNWIYVGPRNGLRMPWVRFSGSVAHPYCRSSAAVATRPRRSEAVQHRFDSQRARDPVRRGLSPVWRPLRSGAARLLPGVRVPVRTASLDQSRA